MHVSLFGLALILTVLALALFTGFAATWRRYAGKRLITCPENLAPAAVDVDALRAASSALVRGTAQLGLYACSRWPEKKGCGQECLAQVEASSDGCLVRTIVASWYAGKRCVVCDQSVGPLVWHERPPALLLPDGTSTEWKEVAPQELPKIFRTCRPLCWTCHLAIAFRRENPSLIVERPRPVAPPAIVKPTVAVY